MSHDHDHSPEELSAIINALWNENHLLKEQLQTAQSAGAVARAGLLELLKDGSVVQVDLKKLNIGLDGPDGTPVKVVEIFVDFAGQVDIRPLLSESHGS